MTILPDDRRRYIRVPISGPVRWRSGDNAESCEALDISPGGTAFQVAASVADQIGPNVTLDVEMGLDMSSRVTDRAKVLRREPRDDGMWTIAVEHPPGEWEDD
jgi:hypothetical protein